MLPELFLTPASTWAAAWWRCRHGNGPRALHGPRHQARATAWALTLLWQALMGLAVLSLCLGAVPTAQARAQAQVQAPEQVQPLPPSAVTAGKAATAVLRWPCLSYAPFRRHGHTPMDPGLRLSEEQLREDLQILSQWTGCIRTYGTGHGQDQIPALAQRLGLQVVQGAWVSRDRSASQAEVDTALALARAFPGTVRMLMIGNEVLLRQERSPEDLASLLSHARLHSPVPVGYADVWEFWLRHAPVLAEAVDTVAIHVLPYWEDDPVAQVRAVDHVLGIHSRLVQAFAGKPVWLAETGWPAAGRVRGPAVPGPLQQARFLRELHHRLGSAGVDYNVIEAFDQPWKRRFEGAMGGAWGIADAQGRLRDAGLGPLPPDPAHRVALWGALTGAAASACVLLFMGVRQRRVTSPQADMPATWPNGHAQARTRRVLLVMVVAAGAGMGMLGACHGWGLPIWLRNPQEWAMALAHAGLALAVCAIGVGFALQAAMGEQGLQQGGGRLVGRTYTFLLTAVLMVTTVDALTLVFDGRYRPLQASLMGAIAAGLWLARMSGRAPRPAAHQGAMAFVLAAAAPALIVMEGWTNLQALALATAWGLMAAALLQRPHPPSP